MKSNSTYKQTFWFSVINYIAIAIGVFSTFFIYPYDLAFFGKIGYIDSLAQMIYPFLVFGSAQTIIRFYPVLNPENQYQLFKFSSRNIFILSFFVGLCLVLGSFVFKWDLYFYLYYAFFLAAAMALIELYKRQVANLNKIAVPALFEKIIPKIAVPVVLLLFIFKLCTEQNALLLYLFFYFILVALLYRYLKKYFNAPISGSYRNLFSHISKKEFYKYSFFAFAGSFGSFLAFRLDGFMIPVFLDFELGGVYRVGVNLASALAIPSVGLFTLYAPQIATYIKNEDWVSLQEKYTQTAIFLFFLGVTVMGCVAVGLPTLFQLLPKTEKLFEALPVIYILGANVVINMGTSFNSEIISFSKYYKFNIIAVAVLVLVNVLLNFLVLTQTSLGILGVALATFISMTLFNMVKLIFIYKKMKMQPFTKKYIRLIIVQLILLVFVYLMPNLNNLWINFFVREIIFVAFTVFVVYKLKTVYLLNSWVDKIILYIQKR